MAQPTMPSASPPQYNTHASRRSFPASASSPTKSNSHSATSHLPMTKSASTTNTSTITTTTTASPPANSTFRTPRRTSSTSSYPASLSSAASSPSASAHFNFVDNPRSLPSGPRPHRHSSSFSASAMADLLIHPAIKSNGDDVRFRGRDWRTIAVHEIIDPAEVRFAELDSTVEDTTKLLVRSGAPNVVLVRESSKTKTPIGMFGYDDLNAYLLLVLGIAQPDEHAAHLAERARNGEALLLKDVRDYLDTGDEPVFLPHTADLTKAMEVQGGGMHRVIIYKEGTTEAVGVLSQLKLVRFFWENHQSFAATESLYARSLLDLQLGAKDVIAIDGETPLSSALRLMHERGITSLPVLDNQRNVVGNISHVDVRLLTDTSAIPLLSKSCIHFISVILSERGLEDGKDAYPVFHVTPFNTLAHTVAKLCATRSHRMWIVDATSPATSVPPSPGVSHHAVPPFGMSIQHQSPQQPSFPNGISHTRTPSLTEVSSAPPPPTTTPGAALSGHLTGVVSLTDVLNLLARASGLSPADPNLSRRRRRRSSSSSSRPRLEGLGLNNEFAVSRSPSRGVKR